MRALGTLTVSGKIENGARMVKRTVCLSTASTRSIGPTSPRYGDAVFGSSSVVKVATTSSATSSRPLWNLTPERSLKVHTRAPSPAVHDSARSGTTSRLTLRRVRLLYIHRVAVHSAPLMCMIGLMVLSPKVTLTRRSPPYFSPCADAWRTARAGRTRAPAAALDIRRNARREALPAHLAVLMAPSSLATTSAPPECWAMGATTCERPTLQFRGFMRAYQRDRAGGTVGRSCAPGGAHGVPPPCQPPPAPRNSPRL